MLYTSVPLSNFRKKFAFAIQTRFKLAVHLGGALYGHIGMPNVG